MWTSVGPWVWARTPALRLAEFPDESNITWHGHAPGKGFIENKHSTEVESIVELESLHISIRNEGKPCFDRFECLFSMTLLQGARRERLHGRAVQADPRLTPGRPRLVSALEHYYMNCLQSDSMTKCVKPLRHLATSSTKSSTWSVLIGRAGRLITKSHYVSEWFHALCHVCQPSMQCNT